MPKYIKGNMWNHITDNSVVLVTGNGEIKKDGNPVMGAGAAKAMVDLMPDAPSKIIESLTEVFGTERMDWASEHKDDYLNYGVVVAKNFVEYNNMTVYPGLFQTKALFRNDSPLPLVEYSVGRLLELASRLEVPVHMNMPAMGLGNRNGEISVNVIKDILYPLPEHVRIYHK